MAHPDFVAALAGAIEAQRAFGDARLIDVPKGPQLEAVRAAARLLPAGRRRRPVVGVGTGSRGTIRRHSCPSS